MIFLIKCCHYINKKCCYLYFYFFFLKANYTHMMAYRNKTLEDHLLQQVCVTLFITFLNKKSKIFLWTTVIYANTKSNASTVVEKTKLTTPILFVCHIAAEKFKEHHSIMDCVHFPKMNIISDIEIVYYCYRGR